MSAGAQRIDGDANGDHAVDGADLGHWRAAYAIATAAATAVPEPGGTTLLAWLAMGVARAQRRRS